MGFPMRFESSRMYSLISAGIVAATFAAGTVLAQQPQPKDTTQNQPKDTTNTSTYGGSTGTADTAGVPRSAHFRCSDGTYSTARRSKGACASHGGIQDTLATWNGNRHPRSKSGDASSTDTMDMSRGSMPGNEMPDTGNANRSVRRHHRTASDTGASDNDNDRDMSSDTGAVRNNGAMSSDTGRMGRRMSRRAMEHDSTNATAKCKDGTWSHGHRKSGTCSRHGGVDRWTGADSTQSNQRQPQQ